MKIPDLVRDGLKSDYETGYDTVATNLMYKHIKKSPEEIAGMIRETWEYIKQGSTSNHIFCHFLYLLQCEVERKWVDDISLDIIQYGLISDDREVVDRTIGLIESWSDTDILELLYNAKFKSDWLTKYKKQVLEDFKYPKEEK